MPVYKDDNGTWYVKGRYKDWTGKTKYLMKRGFSLKREAVEWEKNFHAKKAANPDMTFGQFYELYCQDMQDRLKESTWGTKSNIIETKILPYFEKLVMRDITSLEVIRWQNEMLKLRKQ